MLALRPHERARQHRQARRREVKRLKAHFAGALEMLETRDASGLTGAQRAARADRIADLRRYALRGQFPKNRDFADRMVPYFVDAEGTRCAMAHLVEKTGGVEVVRDIAKLRNNELVPDLASDPRLALWLDAHGLTVAEAARIQPSYCGNLAGACLCTYEVTGVVEVVTALNENGVIVFQVTAVYGEPIYAIGDTFSAGKAFQEVGEGLRFIMPDKEPYYPMYPITEDDLVDTSNCQSFWLGPPPATAPKEAVAMNMLGDCGAGLAPEWTELQGECDPPSTTAQTTGPGSTSSSGSSGAGGNPKDPGNGEGGEGGATGDSDDGDGCSAAPHHAPFGGAMFFASLLIGGAIRLRTRRVRK